MTASSPLPALAPLVRIERPLSVSEYYHAAIGHHPQSHLRAHEVTIVLEGSGTAADTGYDTVDPAAWQAALDRVAAANPGTRLRLSGKRQRARWISDGPPPQLRVVDDCAWDGRSSMGAEALFAGRLALEAGQVAEVILVRAHPRASEMKVIFRASHAAMDGVGTLHFAQETFRALRGEPLLGSNAAYTDAQLMLGAAHRPTWPPSAQLAHMTGGVQGDERGGVWRRISIQGPQPNLLPRLIALLGEYAHRHGNQTARIALPSNLRRHVPGLLSTANFANTVYIDLPAGAAMDVGDIKERLRALHDGNADLNFHRVLELTRYLPFAWLEGLLGVTDRSYRTGKLFETAMLSVLGSYKKSQFSGGGFMAETMYVLPQLENVFLMVSGLQGNYEITVGMRRVFASNGRLEDFLAYLEQRVGRASARQATAHPPPMSG